MKIILKKLSKSDKKDKKYKAEFEIIENDKIKKRTTHFGFNDPKDKKNDYTLHKDIERRNRYINRHWTDLRTNDLSKPGYLSMVILWNKKNIKDAINDYNNKLKIFNKTGKFPLSKLLKDGGVSESDIKKLKIII
tara:strand:- start:985 stop:1389 length:405 start_codon:yes stop_codon:yes gene_type:complete